MPLFLERFWDWVHQAFWTEGMPWDRIAGLFIGEKCALGILAIVCFIGSVAAANRFFTLQFEWPTPRKVVKTPKRKKGFGVKQLVLLSIALLPGGMVGMFTVYSIMGREHWRRDALAIVGGSLIPGFVLLSARTQAFPWPHLKDSVYFSGLLGLTFGMLHVWAMIKLLREWWGEPDECVAWWPPLALHLQILILVCAASEILRR